MPPTIAAVAMALRIQELPARALLPSQTARLGELRVVMTFVSSVPQDITLIISSKLVLTRLSAAQTTSF